MESLRHCHSVAVVVDVFAVVDVVVDVVGVGRDTSVAALVFSPLLRSCRSDKMI